MSKLLGDKMGETDLESSSAAQGTASVLGVLVQQQLYNSPKA